MKKSINECCHIWVHMNEMWDQTLNYNVLNYTKSITGSKLVTIEEIKSNRGHRELYEGRKTKISWVTNKKILPKENVFSEY